MAKYWHNSAGVESKRTGSDSDRHKEFNSVPIDTNVQL
jgi:hypothetical protein